MAELLRRIYDVDPLACPACGGVMRIIAVITDGAVIDRLLTHLRHRPTASAGIAGARSPPAPRAASAPRRRAQPTASRASPT